MSQFDLQLKCWIFGDVHHITVPVTSSALLASLKNRIKSICKPRFDTISVRQIVLYKISVPVEDFGARLQGVRCPEDVDGAVSVISAHKISYYFPQPDDNISVMVKPPTEPASSSQLSTSLSTNLNILAPPSFFLDQIGIVQEYLQSIHRPAMEAYIKDRHPLQRFYPLDDEVEGLVMPKYRKIDSVDKVFARCFQSTLVTNPSGSGTTQLLLEGLQTHWGLYFVPNGSNHSPVGSAESSSHSSIGSTDGSNPSPVWSADGSNPSPILSANDSSHSPIVSADGSSPSPIGSADVQEAVSRIQKAKRFECAGDVTVQQSDTNRVIAHRHFQHVLLIRILFFSFFLDVAEYLHIPFDSCKQHWLYIQLMPNVILKEDVFSVLLKTMGDAPYKYNASIDRRITEIEHRLAPSSYREGTNRLFVVLDHAHVADSQLRGSFINEADRLTPCSALHELIKAWKSARSQIHLIVCGKKISTAGLMDLYSYNSWRVLEPAFYRMIDYDAECSGNEIGDVRFLW